MPWLLIAANSIAFAQDRPPLATDRPGFSDGTHVVAPGTIQLESGFFRTQIGSRSTTSVGDALLRFGVSERWEFRLIGLGYGFGSGTEQWLDPSVGVKVRWIQTTRGEVSLVGQSTVPIGDGALRSNRWNPTLKVAATMPIGRDTLGGNLVWSRQGSGSSRFDQSALSAFLSRPLSAQTTATAELWVVDRIGRGGPGAGFASLALAHLLDNDRQIDLRLGTGLHPRRDGWFLQGGFSIRF